MMMMIMKLPAASWWLLCRKITGDTNGTARICTLCHLWGQRSKTLRGWAVHSMEHGAPGITWPECSREPPYNWANVQHTLNCHIRLNLAVLSKVWRCGWGQHIQCHSCCGLFVFLKSFFWFLCFAASRMSKCSHEEGLHPVSPFLRTLGDLHQPAWHTFTSIWFRLPPPGEYLIVPLTFEPSKEADLGCLQRSRLRQWVFQSHMRFILWGGPSTSNDVTLAELKRWRPSLTRR